MVWKIVCVLLIILLLWALSYISRMRRTEKEWKEVLESVKRGGHRPKVFTSDKGLIAETSFLLNEVIESYNNKIDHLNKVNEANGHILTSLSHDVRTPLASLKGYIDALNDGIVTDEEIPEYLNVASRKSADLKAFVDMLFDWFKLNSGEMQFDFLPQDINELSREILIDWLPVVEKHGFKIDIQIEDSELIVPIDTSAYRRIVNNIMQNALTHSAGDKIAFTITEEKNSICILIADNGFIPEEQIPFLFERLYKGDLARSGKGSGLGLAITKELIRAHGGKILVESTKEQGTAIFLYFSV